MAAGFAAAVIAATCLIYRQALLSYFSDDDFGWLTVEASFRFGDLLHLSRYRHFYRPVIEVYFAAGYRLFGCDALPFHVASLTIHLATVLALYLFAYALTTHRAFAATTALFFAVLPGYVEAVAWVAAITDLLPALWYITTLWLSLRFLHGGGKRFYVMALGTFTACLLTHESAATLLPLMVLVHLVAEGGYNPAIIKRFAPFAALLGAFLVVAYIVNSRSYLITEGHYRLGWHAVPHILQYIVTLYVGKRNLPSYGAIVAVLAMLLVRGTPRLRLFASWILITLLPVSFFTWDNVSRYAYLPAAGFALLLAEAMCALRRWCDRVVGARAARAIAAALIAGLTVRFIFFARKESAAFRDRTGPYERYVTAIRHAWPAPPPDRIVYLDRKTAQLVPESTRDQVAEVAFCMAPVHVVER